MKSHKSNINIKMIIIGIILVILLAIIFFVSGIIWTNSQKVNDTTIITSDLISQRLQTVSELATVKYIYTNMGRFEEGKSIYGIEIPFSKKGFIISYDGEVKAGINMEKLGVNVAGNQIIIYLPESEILSHSIDENSVQLFDESKNIFNQISITDYTEFLNNQRGLIEEKAIQNGLLNEAKDKAKLIIQNILTLSGDLELGYEIIFDE